MSQTEVQLIKADAVQTGDIANSAVTDAKISGVASSKLTGALPAISGAALTNLPPSGKASNLIINGAMQVAQRGDKTGATDHYGGCDRFKFLRDGATAVTLSQDTGIPEQGFSKAQRVDVTTADTSMGGTNYNILTTRMEGRNLQTIKKGTANALPVTISFYIKSTVTGTYILELADNNNSRSCSKAYTVSSSNTWEKKEITFPADTTGAFNDDNNLSMEINWWLGAGPTYSSGTLQDTWGTQVNANRAVGVVNAVNSTSNDIYLTGVQMEVGSVATDFEHRSFAEELYLCQRYFELIKFSYYYTTGYYEGNGNPRIPLYWNVEKRANPTIILPTIGTSAGQLQVVSSGGSWDTASTTLSAVHQTTFFGRLEGSGYGGSSGTVAGMYYNGTNGIIQISAEL